jgi:hypothetical protein
MTRYASPCQFNIEHLNGAFGTDARHREALASPAGDRQEIPLEQRRRFGELLAANTALTEQVHELPRQIHERVVRTMGA